MSQGVGRESWLKDLHVFVESAGQSFHHDQKSGRLEIKNRGISLDFHGDGEYARCPQVCLSFRGSVPSCQRFSFAASANFPYCGIIDEEKGHLITT